MKSMPLIITFIFLSIGISDATVAIDKNKKLISNKGVITLLQQSHTSNRSESFDELFKKYLNPHTQKDEIREYAFCQLNEKSNEVLIAFDSDSIFVVDEKSERVVYLDVGSIIDEKYPLSKSGKLKNSYWGFGDLEGDGIKEIIISEYLKTRGEAVWCGISVYSVINDSLIKKYQISVPVPYPRNIGSLVVSDLNGDGKSEIITEEGAETEGGTVRIYEYNEDSREIISIYADTLSTNFKRGKLCVFKDADKTLLVIGDSSGEVGVYQYKSNGFCKIGDTYHLPDKYQITNISKLRSGILIETYMGKQFLLSNFITEVDSPTANEAPTPEPETTTEALPEESERD